jgi:hypothetical protein
MEIKGTMEAEELYRRALSGELYTLQMDAPCRCNVCLKQMNLYPPMFSVVCELCDSRHCPKIQDHNNKCKSEGFDK